MGDKALVLKAAAQILENQTPPLDQEALIAFVARFLDSRDIYLDLCRRHGSPLYILEEDVLVERARRFAAAFRRSLPDVRFFYAMKSNNLTELAEILTHHGFGLDVSSGEELTQAVGLGARDIIFSGPGKTIGELELAVRQHERVTVLIDSFGELERLAYVAARANVRVRAGVRLTTEEHGLWRKFGIPLLDLPRFLMTAETHAHVILKGLQFHTSWNMNPDAQTAFIARLGGILAGLDKPARSRIGFIDIGGGYWPPQGEWLQSAGTPEGKLRQCVSPDIYASSDEHYCVPSTPIEPFARQITAAINDHIFPHVRCAVYFEPGRWICHDAMHLLLTVVDKKSADLVITDGGTNAIGWERFETDYFPVINLTHPGKDDIACLVLGSLCTPHDVWGYGYFGSAIEPGDVLLIPTQGAYTYSLRQNFIKPLPKVVVRKAAQKDAAGRDDRTDAGRHDVGARRANEE